MPPQLKIDKVFLISEQKKYSLDGGNCITVGLDTQTAFYQPTNFYTGQNIQILKNSNLNVVNAKFLLPLIKNTLSIFSWGGNGATLTRLKRSKLLLPINDAGEPDYEYMEKYIALREAKLIQQYLDHLTAAPPHFQIVPLNEKIWKPFFIEEIFDSIQRGKRLKTADHIEGKIPYVSSSAQNNGVDNFIGNDKKIRQFEDCLTIANSGSVGETFYHSYKFIASDHVTALSSSKLNQWSYLFIAPMLKRLQEKYSFNREINDFRIRKKFF